MDRPLPQIDPADRGSPAKLIDKTRIELPDSVKCKSLPGKICQANHIGSVGRSITDRVQAQSDESLTAETGGVRATLRSLGQIDIQNSLEQMITRTDSRTFHLTHHSLARVVTPHRLILSRAVGLELLHRSNNCPLVSTCHDCGLVDNGDKNGVFENRRFSHVWEPPVRNTSNIGKRAVGKNIQSPLSTVGAVVAQPETQVILKGTTGEMEPANSPDDVGLTFSEGSPRLYSRCRTSDRDNRYPATRAKEVRSTGVLSSATRPP